VHNKTYKFIPRKGAKFSRKGRKGMLAKQNARKDQYPQTTQTLLQGSSRCLAFHFALFACITFAPLRELHLQNGFHS
jgi:hypothetical protein